MPLTRLLVIVVFALCAYPSLAHAQDDAFKKGMQARGDKNWAEVARQMRSAIQGDAQESSRKVRSTGG